MSFTANQAEIFEALRTLDEPSNEHAELSEWDVDAEHRGPGKRSSALAGFPSLDGLGFDAYRASDIDALADQSLEFLIRGFLADGTAGMWGGAHKALKTELQVALDLSITTGIPFLGHDAFTVDRTGPVLTFVGEGGLAPYMRRVRRIARAYGVPVPDDYIVSGHLGSMNDPTFIEQVTDAVEVIDPVLVRIDPYYAYHGGDTEAANLFAQGRLLSQFTEALDGRTFMLTHHFNERGSGTDLSRFAQAGSAQWVDSWVQVVHREPPNPETGEFRLGVKVGSRQWGERVYEIDVSLGLFDMDSGRHRGTPTWAVRRVGNGEVGQWNRSAKKQPRDAKPDIVKALVAQPWKLGRTALVDVVGGKAETTREAIDALVEEGQVTSTKVALEDSSGRMQPRKVLGLVSGSSQELHGVSIPADYPDPPRKTA